MSFLDLNLSPQLCETLQNLGFFSPTPIQQQTIPFVLKGEDVLASAQTGTGKTAAFLLPLIQLLINTRARARLSRAIILEPTRELALQVMESYQAFASKLSLKAALLVGGESMIEQQKILGKGVDVLIATPGRLLDLIERGQLILLGIQHVIIDEADRMLDMGFMPDVNRLMAALPSKKQTLLFSATFPEEIKKLADTYLKSPQRIHITPSERTAGTIKQYVSKVDFLQKRQATQHILEKFSLDKPSIIFCNRKKDISLLVSFLKQQGFKGAGLHGDLSQTARSETVKHFKEGQVKVLVASDIAARGLDVENLGLVINFDIPRNAEDYVHRIGRTGRAGQEGCAFSFVGETEQKTWKLIEKTIDQKVDLYDDPALNVTILSTEKENRSPIKKVQAIAKTLEHIIGFGDFTPAFMLRQVNIVKDPMPVVS